MRTGTNLASENTRDDFARPAVCRTNERTTVRTRITIITTTVKLLFLFCRRHVPCTTTTFAERTTHNGFRGPHRREYHTRYQQQNVQQEILEPIQVVGGRPQMHRPAVPAHVFDPEHGVLQRWQRVVPEHGRCLFHVFLVPAKRGPPCLNVRKNDTFTCHLTSYFRNIYILYNYIEPITVFRRH